MAKAKYDFFAETIDINNENLVLNEDKIKFLNLKYGNIFKKSKILNRFKGKNYFEYKSYVSNEEKDDFSLIKQISGTYDNQQDLRNLQEYIEKLPKYSFAIWFKFKLKAPYFSKDDDEFYIVQNPVIKETNFKVPMIRGSSWKGTLASAFKELLKENKSNIESFLRIFGAGSESIKAIEQALLNETGNLKKAIEKLPEFLLFELGLEVKKEDLQKIKDIKNKKQLFDFIKDKLSEKLNESQNLPTEFQTHKGRAIFYPTYFDKLSLEIINPHDRRKRAGTNPIHYEVVPKGTEGIFQLIYIPFDAVLKSDEDVKNEAKEDLANIIKALRVLSNKGIGAKTKLGWGRFEFLDDNQKICLNSNLKIPEGWEKCQSSS